MKKLKNKLLESNAPVDFINRDDMCQELQKYCYDFFDSEDNHITELGKIVEDLTWDDTVAGVTVAFMDRKSPVIVFNPFFAEQLLDKQAERHNGEWSEEGWEEEYYKLFRYALLWAAYVALTIKTEHINTNNVDGYLQSWKHVVDVTYSELIQSFGDYREAQDEFKKLIADFALARF